jgi:glycosyltransferase involved in cell wall biosynthesis
MTKRYSIPMNKQLTILYLIPAEGFGGAERQALFHIENLPRYGIKVITVTGPGKRVLDHLHKLNITAKFYPHIPKEYGKPFAPVSFVFHLFITGISYIRTFHFLFKLLRQENVDLIFASRVTGWALAAPLSRLFSIPCIWRFGSRVQGFSQRLLLRTLSNVFKPAMTIANCNAVFDSVKNLVHSPLVVIANGIDLKNYDPNVLEQHYHRILDISSEIPIIGLAVRPSPDKGMDFFGEIVRNISMTNTPAHFCIAGEFGWRKQIEYDFEKRGLKNRVSFLGHIENINSFYSECSIVVLTSRERSIEGFPNSLLEAMALCKPVIATDSGGIPELIDHGKSGIIVKGMNADEFASEILMLLRSPEKMVQYGLAARNKVIEMYSIEKTVKPVAMNIYKVREQMQSTKYKLGSTEQCQKTFVEKLSRI